MYEYENMHVMKQSKKSLNVQKRGSKVKEILATDCRVDMCKSTGVFKRADRNLISSPRKKSEDITTGNFISRAFVVEIIRS